MTRPVTDLTALREQIELRQEADATAVRNMSATARFLDYYAETAPTTREREFLRALSDLVRASLSSNHPQAHIRRVLTAAGYDTPEENA